MIVPQIQAIRTRIPKWVNVKKLLGIVKSLKKETRENPRVPELNPPGVFLNNLSITKVPNLYEKHVPYSPSFGLLSKRAPNTWADKAAVNKLANELRQFASKNGIFDSEVSYIKIPKRGSNPIDGTLMIKEAEFKIAWRDLNGAKIFVIATAQFDDGGNFVPPAEFTTANGQTISFVKENVAQLSEGRVFAKPIIMAPTREITMREPDFTRMYKGSSKKAAHATGDRVEYAGEDGEIIFDNGDGTYVVRNDSGQVSEDVPGTALRRILPAGEPTLPVRTRPMVEPGLRKKPMIAKKASSKLSFRDADSLFPFAEDSPQERLSIQTDVEPDYSKPLRESDQGWGISKGPRGLKNDDAVGKIERNIGTGVSLAALPELNLRKEAAVKLYELPIDELRTRIFDFAKRAKMPLAFNLRDIYSFSKEQLTEIMGDMLEYNFALASSVFGIEKTGKIVEEKGEFHVESEEGKNLGGGPTKEKAVKRLRQVEYFKHHPEKK